MKYLKLHILLIVLIVLNCFAESNPIKQNSEIEETETTVFFQYKFTRDLSHLQKYTTFPSLKMNYEGGERALIVKEFDECVRHYLKDTYIPYLKFIKDNLLLVQGKEVKRDVKKYAEYIDEQIANPDISYLRYKYSKGKKELNLLISQTGGRPAHIYICINLNNAISDRAFKGTPEERFDIIKEFIKFPRTILPDDITFTKEGDILKGKSDVRKIMKRLTTKYKDWESKLRQIELFIDFTVYFHSKSIFIIMEKEYDYQRSSPPYPNGWFELKKIDFEVLEIINRKKEIIERVRKEKEQSNKTIPYTSQIYEASYGRIRKILIGRIFEPVYKKEGRNEKPGKRIETVRNVSSDFLDYVKKLKEPLKEEINKCNEVRKFLALSFIHLAANEPDKEAKSSMLDQVLSLIHIQSLDRKKDSKAIQKNKEKVDKLVSDMKKAFKKGDEDKVKNCGYSLEELPPELTLEYVSKKYILIGDLPIQLKRVLVETIGDTESVWGYNPLIAIMREVDDRLILRLCECGLGNIVEDNNMVTRDGNLTIKKE